MKRNLPEAYFGQVSLYESVKEAFDAVRRDKKEEERVYIVGSLYLVGEIKEYVNHDKF